MIDITDVPCVICNEIRGKLTRQYDHPKYLPHPRLIPVIIIPLSRRRQCAPASLLYNGGWALSAWRAKWERQFFSQSIFGGWLQSIEYLCILRVNKECQHLLHRAFPQCTQRNPCYRWKKVDGAYQRGITLQEVGAFKIWTCWIAMLMLVFIRTAFEEASNGFNFFFVSFGFCSTKMNRVLVVVTIIVLYFQPCLGILVVHFHLKNDLLFGQLLLYT